MSVGNSFRDSITSRVLALVRWPLVMCIVAVHVFADSPFVAGGIDYTPGTAVSALTLFVRAFLSENGVATFFFISGFLFMAGGQLDKTKYRSKVGRRVHSLLVPYMLWNLIALLYFLVLVWHSATDGVDIAGWLGGFVMSRHSAMPHDPAMWFIRDLMLCVAAVPPMYVLMKHKWPSLAVLCLMFAVCVCIFPASGSYAQLVVSALVFFFWGMWMAMHYHDLAGVFRRVFVPCLVLYPLLGGLLMVLYPANESMAMVVKCLSLIVVVPLVVDIACWCAGRGMVANRFLTGAAFFVFASHCIVLFHFKVLVFYLVQPRSEAAMALTFVCMYVLLLGFLLGTFAILKRVFPAIANLLTGKR